MKHCHSLRHGKQLSRWVAVAWLVVSLSLSAAHAQPAADGGVAELADDADAGPAPPLPEETAAPDARVLEESRIVVEVQGSSKAERQMRSAEAITVIDTQIARRRSADMGELLARTQGVTVRRLGGLGSESRIYLNGLTGEQVRLMLDGIPLEFSGYPFGISNVPVNLVERIEIYRGVLPVRLGADALGGAVNLVSDQAFEGTHAAGSYEIGSFDTHRLSLSARHLHDPSGFFTRISGFHDTTRNNYPIDVEVPDASGQQVSARAYRFHDGYRATGGNLELGFVKRPWARKLLLRAFITDYDKEYQHNRTMTIVYGGMTYAEANGGATLHYQHTLAPGVTVDATAGYSYTRSHFLDIAQCVYDWFGRCVRERRKPGELDGDPHDQLFWEHSGFARANVSWRISPFNALRLSVAPTYTTRTGDERLPFDPSDRDPLTAQRDLLSLVSGIEYELHAFDAQLENVFFVKQYLQFLSAEDVRPGNVFKETDRVTPRFGIGNGLRYELLDWLHAKLSYELATRLPSSREIFGDNLFVKSNLELSPEVSHNFNAELRVPVLATPIGDLRGSVMGFLRETENLIILLGAEGRESYRNVYGARSLGVEAAASWTSPREYFVLDGNATFQSFRNTASEGTFGAYAGDPIPHRPNVFANASARVQLSDVATRGDRVSLYWTMRYVKQFYRGWESLGLAEFKQFVPAQLVHSIGLGYVVSGPNGRISTNIELSNITDETTYDFFGVQRPRRALYAKTTLEL